MEVGGGLGGYGLRRGVAELRQKGCGVGGVGGLVLLATQRDRREEWGVGLDEDAVGGGFSGDLLDQRRFGVGKVAGEGEIAALASVGRTQADG